MAGEPPRCLQPQTAASSPAELKYLQIFTFITNVFANISLKILFAVFHFQILSLVVTSSSLSPAVLTYKHVDRDHDHEL